MEQFVEYIKSLTGARFTGPVSQGLIIKSQSSLGVKFSDEYLALLRNFGNMFYKHNEVLGLTTEHIDDCYSYTAEAREEDPTIPQNMYVISSAGIDGILFLQDAEGNVYQHTPFGECKHMYDSLEAFIKSF